MTDLLWAFLNKYRLAQSISLQILNSSQKIVKQLVSGYSVKKKQKNQNLTLELRLCNQTSRQILIFSKLFPSFHHESFHLDLLYPEHHQTVPVTAPVTQEAAALPVAHLSIPGA